MLSHLDVVKSLKESVTSLESDSVEHRLNTLTAAVDQLLLDVQVRHWCFLAEVDVVFIIFARWRHLKY